jgi:predicted aspartyl protease
MRALKNVVIRFLGKEVSCTALFDTGSGVTAVQRSFFEESFGAKWSTLDKPLRLYWINGESIQADKYAHITITIDGFNLPETVLVIDNFIKEIEVEGRKIHLPELIVGSGTMDKYGITLDPKEGIKLTGASLLL